MDRISNQTDFTKCKAPWKLLSGSTLVPENGPTEVYIPSALGRQHGVAAGYSDIQGRLKIKS